MKIGLKKGSSKSLKELKVRENYHKHVPGVAFDTFINPSQKLMSMVAGGFFNEPKYYDTNRSIHDFYRELHEEGCSNDY